MLNEIPNTKIALLIDAENVSDKYIKYILDELSNYGIPTYKRIYGDWSAEAMKRWKNVLMTYSITAIQQYSYTSGKNSSDSALIIDAMDILYSNKVQGFCIVSSDSDFTRLATRLREAGMLVIGMGELKTPKSLISACDKFLYLEVLIPKETKTIRKPKEYKTIDKFFDKKPVKEKPITKEIETVPVYEPVVKEVETNISEPVVEIVKEEPQPICVGEDINAIVDAIKVIINEISNEDGVASLADIGNALNRRFPEFDARNYGFSKFSQFMSSLNGFEVIKQRPEGHPGIVHIYIKLKNN